MYATDLTITLAADAVEVRAEVSFEDMRWSIRVILCPLCCLHAL